MTDGSPSTMQHFSSPSPTAYSPMWAIISGRVGVNGSFRHQNLYVRRSPYVCGIPAKRTTVSWETCAVVQ
jgi:hypothetical protein